MVLQLRNPTLENEATQYRPLRAILEVPSRITADNMSDYLLATRSPLASTGAMARLNPPHPPPEVITPTAEAQATPTSAAGDVTMGGADEATEAAVATIAAALGATTPRGAQDGPWRDWRGTTGHDATSSSRYGSDGWDERRRHWGVGSWNSEPNSSSWWGNPSSQWWERGGGSSQCWGQ